MDARVQGITNYVTGRGLARFIDGLDFRGWRGEQHWVNSNRDLKVSAVYGTRGHIALTWTLRTGIFGTWEARVMTWLEAGAAKDDFAARLHHFLTADEFPVVYGDGGNEFGDWPPLGCFADEQGP